MLVASAKWRLRGEKIESHSRFNKVIQNRAIELRADLTLNENTKKSDLIKKAIRNITAAIIFYCLSTP